MKFLNLLLLTLLPLFSISNTTTALGGNWTSTSTWDNGIPDSNTTKIIIPRNVVVLIKNQIVDLSSTNTEIELYGTLEMERTGNSNISELLLGLYSTITIDTTGNIIAISNKNDKYTSIRIEIGSFNEVWDGSDGDINMPGILNYNTTDGSLTPLPIVLGKFYIENNETSMIFKWETLSEINNDYFNIEQLVGDDVIVIGTVAGSGTTSYTSKYEFEYPLASGYFRLTQVDYDGKSVSYEFIYNYIEAVDVINQYYDINGNPSNTPHNGFNIITDGVNTKKVFISK